MAPKACRRQDMTQMYAAEIMNDRNVTNMRSLAVNTCSRHTWTQSDITQTDRPLWLQMTSPVRDGSTWIRSTDRRKTNMEIFVTPLQPCECCICLLISLTSKLICHHHHHRRKGRKCHTFLFIFELLINSVAVLSLSVWV